MQQYKNPNIKLRLGHTRHGGIVADKWRQIDLVAKRVELSVNTHGRVPDIDVGCLLPSLGQAWRAQPLVVFVSNVKHVRNVLVKKLVVA